LISVFSCIFVIDYLAEFKTLVPVSFSSFLTTQTDLFGLKFCLNTIGYNICTDLDRYIFLDAKNAAVGFKIVSDLN